MRHVLTAGVLSLGLLLSGVPTMPVPVAASPHGQASMRENNCKRVLKKVKGRKQWVKVCNPRVVPLSTPFRELHGIDLDTKGNIYVADRANLRIVKLSPSGRHLAEFTGFSAPELSQEIGPFGVAVDSKGNVYAGTGSSDDYVVKYAPSGKRLAQWGALGHGPGQFSAPLSVSVDGQNNVYVADSGNNRIQKLSPTGQVLKIWGSGNKAPLDLGVPVGLTVDRRGNMYISEDPSNRVQKLSRTGKELVTLAGPETLLRPRGLALDRAGNVYVNDSGHKRIVKLSPTGKILDEIGAKGHFGNVQVDVHGTLYVATVHAVVKLSPRGRVLATWH